MIDYKVKKGAGIWFDENAEYLITKLISDIVRKYRYKVYAYNICKDHIHMLIECNFDKLADTVKTLKGLSSVCYKDILKIPRNKAYHLWAQKYNRWRIETDEQFRNTLLYIIHNRKKHMLPENKGLKPLVLAMIQTCGNINHEIEYEKEIDRTCGERSRTLVYELYGLTEEEIKIVESEK